MAFSAVAARGTGASSASASTLTVTPTATMAVGQLALLTIACDNTSTTDGNNNEVTGVSDNAGGNTWFKCGEQTNGNGTAAAGITVAVFACVLATQLTTSSTVTITFTSNRADKCAALHEFSVGAGNGVKLSQTANGNVSDASTAFGSQAISPSLSSAARLYWRGLARAANVTTNLTTVTTNFTTAGYTIRSRNNAAAVIARAEYRINTSTGETSAPSHTTSGDSAGVFFALEEVPPLSLAQSGNLAMSGTAGVSGDLLYTLPPSGGFKSALWMLPKTFGNTPVNLSFAPSAALALSGTAGVSGNFGYDLSKTQSGAVAMSATLGVSGNLEYGWPLVQSGSVGLTGGLTLGSTAFTLNIGVGGTISMSGSLGVTGDITKTGGQVGAFKSALIFWPYSLGAKTFAITQSGVIGLSGTLSASGNLAYNADFAVAVSGALALTGALGVTGNISKSTANAGFGDYVALWPYGLGIPHLTPFSLVQSGAIGMSGTLTHSGNILADTPWEFVQPLDGPVMSGALSVSGDISALVPKLVLVQSGVLGLSGAISITGNVNKTISLTQSGQVGMAASVAVSGDVSFGVPLVYNFSQSQPLGLTGSLGLTGAISYNVLTLQGSGVLPLMSGSVTITGDLSYFVPVLFSLSQVGALGLAGTLSVVGDPKYGYSVAQAGAVPMSGSMGVSGDITFGFAYYLIQSGSLDMFGQIGAGAASFSYLNKTFPLNPKNEALIEITTPESLTEVLTSGTLV